jgi:hypothetical protein
MKTLEKPLSPADPKTYRIRCTNRACKALMEVAEEELNLRSDAKHGRDYWFLCPHCGKQVVTSAEVLPSKQWHRADVSPAYE